ncbi:NUDIX hydrolase [Streptomyces sp. ODS28]|uniref:NUDIX hydrolase n=1 Tax=Streptomyces sp. ODS28 TaxID=3136688 RepID=UPI0031F0AB33
MTAEERTATAAPGGVESVVGQGAGGQSTVLAAGCVLWRRSPYDGGVEVALVHRPKYDDWSHPKGKLKRREREAGSPLAAALREVYEETGMECVPGAALPTARYLVDGRPKQVSYWAAEATGGGFAPNDEVDRLIWLPPAAARARLTHERDRPLVDALLSTLRA